MQQKIIKPVQCLVEWWEAKSRKAENNRVRKWETNWRQAERGFKGKPLSTEGEDRSRIIAGESHV